MSRKRSLDETNEDLPHPPNNNDETAPAAAAAAALEEAHSSDDDNLKTPRKQPRLDLTRGDSSASEQSRAAAFVQAPAGMGHGGAPITPGPESARKVAAAATAAGIASRNTSESSSSDTPSVQTKIGGARRFLFASPNAAEPNFVSPPRPSPVDQLQSPAKRRLVFGRYASEIAVGESVKKVYALIKKSTGGIGGNASHGPIYGELTMGSMQKMINLMKEHTNFDTSSRFMDVGSGIGKPNFHVAHDPGVELSYGIEVDADRWLLSMTCLKGTLTAAAAGDEQLQQQSCIFVQNDIRCAKVFDPFTHVYMFSIGFPPDLWLELAKIWNRSRTPYLVCFHGPKDIIQNYEFEVELLAQTQTSMHGSKEGHTGYVYRRKRPSKEENDTADGEKENENVATDTRREDPPVPDPLYSEGIETLKGGFQSVKEWVDKTLDEKMSSPRGRRRCRNNSRHQDA